MNAERKESIKGVLEDLKAVKTNRVSGSDALKALNSIHEDIDDCLFDERECLDQALRISTHSKRIDNHDHAIANMEDACRELKVAIEELKSGVSSEYEDIEVYVEFAIPKLEAIVQR